MTFNEIVELLTAKGLHTTMGALTSAVWTEAESLKKAESYVRSDHHYEEKAREFLAEDITCALTDSEYLNPDAVLGHRERYIVAWAIAEIMKREKALPEGMEVEETEDVSKTLVDICKANAELGLRVVELMMRIDEKDTLIETLRGLAEQQIEQDGPSEVDIARGDVVIAVKNLCWMVERVHQSYHCDVPGADQDITSSSWRECSRGVCGSMEHMLSQVGLDKNLKPTDRRP